jgi:hypothetical protein
LRGGWDVRDVEAEDGVVTYNTGDFAAAGERFGIAVLRPGEVLRRVKP